MLRGTQDTVPVASVSCTGLSPPMVGLSSAVPLPTSPFQLSYNPDPGLPKSVWAAPLSLATTYGIFSFPPGT